MSKEKILRNLTPNRLHIRGSEDRLLVLAPLEKDRRLPAAELQGFKIEVLESQNLIAVSDDEKWYEKIVPFLPFIGGSAFFVFLFGNAQTEKNQTHHFWFLIISGVVVLLSLSVGILALWKGGKVVWRFAEQFLSLLLILSLGIALPALAIYHFGGGRELLAVGQPSLALPGRLLQLLFIITASLLPALLYFLFDRQQLGTLRNRFEHQIFRLDPYVETVVDVQAKYGEQVADVYGPVFGRQEGRLIRGTRWPIVVATLVITMGWLLTLLPFEPNLAINQPGDILGLFAPRPTPVVFGFLGAYFFTLNMSLLRYARADLKPKAYSSITVRFFVVVILAWVISSLPLANANPVKLVFIFLVGIFPETGLTLIREYLRRQSGLFGIIRYPREWHPLTNLEGIDVYDRARLADEGVTNIEGLAHHDLIDLMLETRIPTPRLVDWLDQAILYLHLSTDNPGDDQKPDNHAAGASIAADLRRCLREYGIRTASDLLKAREGGKLKEILSEKDKETWNRIEVVWHALKDDEWFDYVKHWREHSGIKDATYDVPNVSEQPAVDSSSQEALPPAGDEE